MKKYIVLLSAMLFLSITAQAQYYNDKEGEKLSKKEQRRLKKEEARKKYEIHKSKAMDLLEKRDFVLQADRINSKKGVTQAVSRNVNFIVINGEDMILQYALNNASAGFNGVGGMTVEGKIKKFEALNRGEGKPFMVTIQFYTPYLSGIVTVQLNIKGDKADAILYNGRAQLTMAGAYSNIEESGIRMAKNRGAFN